MLDITPDEWEQELSVNLTGMELRGYILSMSTHSHRHVLSVSASSETDDQARCVIVPIDENYHRSTLLRL